MHKSVLSDCDTLHYQEKDGKRLLSNGHWLIDLDTYPLNPADLGFVKPDKLPEVQNGAYTIDTISGDVQQGPDQLRLLSSIAPLDQCVKLDETSPIAVFSARDYKTKGEITCAATSWIKKGPYKYSALSIAVIKLKAEDPNYENFVGINPRYFACAVTLLGCHLYVPINSKSTLCALDQIQMIKDNKLVGVFMPMQL